MREGAEKHTANLDTPLCVGFVAATKRHLSFFGLSTAPVSPSLESCPERERLSRQQGHALHVLLRPPSTKLTVSRLLLPPTCSTLLAEIVEATLGHGDTLCVLGILVSTLPYSPNLLCSFIAPFRIISTRCERWSARPTATSDPLRHERDPQASLVMKRGRNSACEGHCRTTWSNCSQTSSQGAHEVGRERGNGDLRGRHGQPERRRRDDKREKSDGAPRQGAPAQLSADERH